MNNELERSVGTWDTITKKGNTYYRFRRTYGNERKEFTGKTKKEVQKKIDAYEANPQTRQQTQTLKMPFHQYLYECGTYFSHIKREATEGPNKMQMDSIRHIQDSKLGKAQLGSVDAALITDFIMEMRDKEYSRRTINGDLGFIKRCLNRALEDNLIKKNPANEVAPIQEKEVIKKTKKVSSLQLSDIEKLINEAQRRNTDECTINGSVGTRVYGVNADVICFLLYTGLRIGECLALTWNDIIMNGDEMEFINITSSLKEEKDSDGNTILVRGTTKTKCSKRLIAINEPMREVLLYQKKHNKSVEGDDFIFQTETGKPIFYHNVNRTLQTMLKRAKCSTNKASAHSLRHSYGSVLLSFGASVFNVSKLLGHSDTRVTEEVYLELLTNSNKETSALINNLKKI